MVAKNPKIKIVKETFPSETISIVGDLLAGIVLSLLILPFQSFILLILIVPALLSLRGNISGPFIARTSRDIVIGEFNIKRWLENVSATFLLSLITAFVIGVCGILLNVFLIKVIVVNSFQLLAIPILSILMTLSVSIPTSTGLNYIAFKFGIDPNNFVNPTMTAIDDFFTVISFYLTILILGVP